MTVNYETLTNRIIAALEQGVSPWAQSWKSTSTPFTRPRRADGTAYRGVNVLNLYVAKQDRGFKSDFWMTYKKAEELGGQVIKGAKSEKAYYASSFTANRDTEDERTVPFLKAFAVFNADEIEGLPAHFYGSVAPIVTMPHGERHKAADAFIADTGADIRHGGDSAHYNRTHDYIQLPEFADFFNPAAYYSTAFHELAHWSGSEDRLNRTKGKQFGDSAYAFEELVAELSAAYLCADLGLSPEPREDHASYISHWIKVLKGDPKAIFRAASLAEKAVQFLHDIKKVEKIAA